MSFLSIQNISKRYAGSDGPIEVLRGLSLELDSGRIHTFAGPSGCGKSTLLMLCGALIHPDSGTITIGGENLLSLNDRRQSAGEGERSDGNGQESRPDHRRTSRIGETGEVFWVSTGGRDYAKFIN